MSIPSIYGVAWQVLDRIMLLQEKKKLDKAYNVIFRQQEHENIMERIDVSPQDFHKFVRMPHRAVFKSDQQMTTKLRPVFNRSLKTENGYSVKEASYPEVNMINSILELLLLFIIDKYVPL